jgi:Fe-S-cluster containining protein
MPNELDVLSPPLRREVERATREGVPPGGCLWFDRAKKACLHYDERPEVCRQFELGGEECVGLWSQVMMLGVNKSA